MLPNLRATPHGYIYLKTVPADLVPAIGKTVIKKSLGRDFKLAKVRWAELEAETKRRDCFTTLASRWRSCSALKTRWRRS